MARTKHRRRDKPQSRKWGFWLGQGRQVVTRDGDSVPVKDCTRQDGYWVQKDRALGERDRPQSY
jgi:hypothetical protein